MALVSKALGPGTCSTLPAVAQVCKHESRDPKVYQKGLGGVQSGRRTGPQSSTRPRHTECSNWNRASQLSCVVICGPVKRPRSGLFALFVTSSIVHFHILFPSKHLNIFALTTFFVHIITSSLDWLKIQQIELKIPPRVPN